MPDDPVATGPTAVGLRAVVAEDQALLRVGLTRILEASGISVVAAVDNAPSLSRALASPEVDVAVVDVRMPPSHTTEGLVAAVEVRRARPGFPVLVLSQYVEPLYARELLASGEGAVGYLLKDRVADVDGFVAAVRQVASGGTVLDPEVVSQLVTRRRRDDRLSELTAREQEVLALIAEGQSNTAIADRLFIGEGTVEKHISNIFSKLGLDDAVTQHRRVLAVLAYLRG